MPDPTTPEQALQLIWETLTYDVRRDSCQAYPNDHGEVVEKLQERLGEEAGIRGELRKDLRVARQARNRLADTMRYTINEFAGALSGENSHARSAILEAVRANKAVTLKVTTHPENDSISIEPEP